jgi:hypothetical protein
MSIPVAGSAGSVFCFFLRFVLSACYGSIHDNNIVGRLGHVHLKLSGDVQ